MKTCIIFFLVIVSFSCKKNLSIGAIYKNVPNYYEFKFSRNSKIIKLKSDDPFIEYSILFPKNQVVFISNNDKDGSSVNNYKYDVYGKGIGMKILTSDSLVLFGKNKKGNWKEVKKEGLVFGYLNIPQNKIQDFENILSTRKIKK